MTEGFSSSNCLVNLFPMECTLHIGTEKTATTSIQLFLDANRHRLKSLGVHIPNSEKKGNHVYLSTAAYSPDKVDDLTMRLNLASSQERERYIQQCRKQLQLDKQCAESHGMRHCLFSNEHLQSRLRQHEEVARLKEILSGLGYGPFRIILYIRDPVQVAGSLYSTLVIAGETRKGPPPPDTPYYENICNHRQTIERWVDVFGKEALYVRLFEPKALINGSVVDDFCYVNKWQIKGSWERPQPANERLSNHGVECLRYLNKRIPRFRDGKTNSVRGDLSSYVRLHMTGPGYVPPETISEAYRSAFQSSNEWVREHYFPERASLFTAPPPSVPTPTTITPEEMEKVADLIADIWESKQQALNRIAEQLGWWKSLKRTMAGLIPRTRRASARRTRI